MLTGQPIFVLKEGTSRDSGKNAQSKNIAAARAISDAVRSTLGPKGMDKMLVDSMGDVVITNDGVTILKEIDVEHPAAKMLIEVAKTQDEECGDGTTTAVILAGELLRQAELLTEQNVHPTTINNGYRLAADRALEVMREVAMPVTIEDTKTLRNIAETAMTGKSAGPLRVHLGKIAVDAVTRVAEDRNGKLVVDLDNVKVEKKQGGTISDSALVDGIILDKERVHSGMPQFVKGAKIALIDSAMEIKKTEVDAKININDPDMLNAFLAEEERILRLMVEKVKNSGANVVICQKGIDDVAQHYMSKAGMFAIRRAKKSDMEKLARATGARIVTNLDDLSKDDLGAARTVEETKVSGDDMTFVTGCKNPKAVSILIRGGTEHVIDEIDRALNDALHVVAVALEDGKVITGGGSTAMEIVDNLRDYAASVGGREQMAIEAYAQSLEIVPRTLAENAGIDAIDTLIKIRTAHKDGKRNAGLNVENGKIEDMLKNNVIEPLRVGTQAINSATEAAVMILRIDDVIAAKGGAGGGPGGMPGGGAGGMGGGMDEDF
ncbi:MAG: TCP-1/cpn60 chaperonin family protein [Thermoplasmata archaeon]|nr:TCP-1/cpn60 chaperonin family protein [Thermoplasmata archaeon]